MVSAGGLPHPEPNASKISSLVLGIIAFTLFSLAYVAEADSVMWALVVLGGAVTVYLLTRLFVGMAKNAQHFKDSVDMTKDGFPELYDVLSKGGWFTTAELQRSLNLNSGRKLRTQLNILSSSPFVLTHTDEFAETKYRINPEYASAFQEEVHPSSTDGFS